MFSVDIRPQTFNISLQMASGGSYSGNTYEYLTLIDAVTKREVYLQVSNGILYILSEKPS